MIKKLSTILLVFILAGITGISLEAKVVALPDLVKPARIIVTKDRMYAVEKATIYIYSLKDFKLIKKFGKLGSGPQEFRVARMGEFLDVDLQVLKDKLQVNSLNKISYFTLDGKFISEKSLRVAPLYLTPLGNGFAGRYGKGAGGIAYHTWLIVNKDIKTPQEVHSEKAFYQRGAKLRVVSRRPSMFLVQNDKLYIEEKEKGIIHVFDPTGKKLGIIDPKLKQVPFTAEDKKKLIDFFMADAIIRPQYLGTKHLTVFDSHFPRIWSMKADNGKLYILSYEKKDDNRKFYILDLNDNGKLIKTVWLPVVQMDGEKPYPFAISNDTFYHLCENLEEEEWELHIHTIK